MIGHSIGPAFILRLLERIDSPIKAAFLVSAWIGNTGSEKFDPINKTFTTGDFNWEKIKQNCKTFYMFNSNNDPYVPFERTKELANKLDIKITIVKDGKHINETAGFVEFPQLLESIKKEVGL